MFYQRFNKHFNGMLFKNKMFKGHKINQNIKQKPNYLKFYSISLKSNISFFLLNLISDL